MDHRGGGSPGTRAAPLHPELRIAVDVDGEVARVTLAGEVDFRNSSRLRRTFDDLLGRLPPPRVIAIELQSLGFMDSSGVAALLVARAKATPVGSRIMVSSASPFVARLLAVTGLGELLLESQGSTSPRRTA